MFIKSIRFKITFLYMVILAITLAFFSAVVYKYMSYNLYESIDKLLLSKAEGIEKAIDTYWEAERLNVVGDAVDEKALSKRRNINFSKIAQRWVEQESTDPRLLDIIVRIFNTDGLTIASSKAVPLEVRFVSKRDFLSVLQGRERFDTINAEMAPAKMTGLRVFSTPVIENDKVAYIVQVASPLSTIETALANLRMTLAVVSPLAVLATGIVGYLLGLVALHPVGSMIRTIRQITAANLKLKIAIPDTNDEIQHLAETFDDMLGRLEHAFTSQRQFTEDLSHELRTPLTVMKGEFEVMLKKRRTPEEYESVLRSSLEEIDAITGLVDNLLMLARLDSKEIKPEMKPVRLTSLLSSIIDDLKPLSEQKKIALVFSAEGRIELRADEPEIKRLFVNLVDNAIKYTPPGGKVTVEAREKDGLAKVTVADTGVGVAEKELPHIFDRFYRLDKSRASIGFGLGLSIAKSIAEMHRGTIAVESRLGAGTKFIVTLPVKC
ncbi:MAG: HAMP domain-containing protein [Candidatus Omnitrophica bacterium]|nr:HAMP domain-containing protein [Candidatus Omnitrophota bacterium]